MGGILIKKNKIAYVTIIYAKWSRPKSVHFRPKP